MRRIGSIDELKIFEEVVVLGAGKDGKSVAEALLQRGIKVHSFIDDSRCGRSYFGINVLSPKELCINNLPCILCIGAFTYLSDDQIMAHRFIKDLRVDSDNLIVLDQFRFIRKRFLSVCKKNHIDLNDNVIDLDKFRIPNYLKMSENIQRTFMAECRDLILPSVFDDYSCVDEGPYDYDNVSVCQFKGGYGCL